MKKQFNRMKQLANQTVGRLVGKFNWTEPEPLLTGLLYCNSCTHRPGWLSVSYFQFEFRENRSHMSLNIKYNPSISCDFDYGSRNTAGCEDFLKATSTEKNIFTCGK